MAKIGRPSKYSIELADRICKEIASQPFGLQHICDTNEDFPVTSTVYEWLIKYPDFSENYTRAREQQADLLADEIIQIADTPQEGTKTKSTAAGVEVVIGDMIEHRRLQVDARKWKASKLAPKKYGDKVDVTSNGEAVAPFILQVTSDQEEKIKRLGK